MWEERWIKQNASKNSLYGWREWKSQTDRIKKTFPADFFFYLIKEASFSASCTSRSFYASSLWEIYDKREKEGVNFHQKTEIFRFLKFFNIWNSEISEIFLQIHLSTSEFFCSNLFAFWNSDISNFLLFFSRKSLEIILNISEIFVGNLLLLFDTLLLDG